MAAKVEWYQGELYPRVGFIVTNLNRPPERVVKFYNIPGRPFSLSRLPQASRGLFHASAVFPQDAVTIDGETRRDYAGRFFCPRCGSSVFGRTADEIEVNVGSLDALTN